MLLESKIMFQRNIVSLCFILSKHFQLNCGESVRLRLGGADTPIRSSHGFHFISFQPPFHKPPPTTHGMKYDAKNFSCQFETFFDNFSWNWIQHKDFLEVVLTHYLKQEVSISHFFPVFADHLTCPVNLVLKHSGQQF